MTPTKCTTCNARPPSSVVQTQLCDACLLEHLESARIVAEREPKYSWAAEGEVVNVTSQQALSLAERARQIDPAEVRAQLERNGASLDVVFRELDRLDLAAGRLTWRERLDVRIAELEEQERKQRAAGGSAT